MHIQFSRMDSKTVTSTVFTIILFINPGYGSDGDSGSVTAYDDTVLRLIGTAVMVAAGGIFAAIAYCCYHCRSCPVAEHNRNEGIVLRRARPAGISQLMVPNLQSHVVFNSNPALHPQLVEQPAQPPPYAVQPTAHENKFPT